MPADGRLGNRVSDPCTGTRSDAEVALSSLTRSPENILSWRRVSTAIGIGLIAALPVALTGHFELAPVVGWIVATVVALVVVWRIVWPQDHAATKRLAERESRSHSTDTIVLIAAVLSFVAVGEALAESSSASNQATLVSVFLSIAAVVVSWCLVNTVFALKYARAYYLDEDGVDDPGGIELTDGEPPAYSDFAFVAFVMGMSYAPPETKFTTKRMRKLALAHALLAYVFGTGVLAVTINLVANVAQR